MQIIIGADWKTSAAGWLSAVGNISAALTTFLAVLAIQAPQHSWVWVVLSAGVLCAASVARILIGQRQNYVQQPPLATPKTPMVVEVPATVLAEKAGKL